MKNLLVIIGCRPQFIKLSQIYSELKKNFNLSVYDTKQHYDKNLSEIFINDMKFVPKLSDIIPDAIMVIGDTKSTLFGANYAIEKGIRLIHLESGLRSNDSNMIEEQIRISVDEKSSLLLSPTPTAHSILLSQKKNSKLVGDLMYEKFKDTSMKWIDCPEEFYYVTFHRAELCNNEEQLVELIDKLSWLKKDIILPIHPRLKNSLNHYDLNFSDNVKIIDPISYEESKFLLQNCNGVISDSGGITREAHYANKPCCIYRDSYEFPELGFLPRLSDYEITFDHPSDYIHPSFVTNNIIKELKEFI